MTLRRRELWVGAVFVVLFVVARVVPFMAAKTGGGLDSLDYRASARMPILSRDFLAGARPLGYPLYIKILRFNDTAVVVGQLIVDTIAWLALALMAARGTRNSQLRAAAAIVVLLIGATFEAIQWDRVVSSEALSTAFGLGVLAGMLWLRERWTWPRVAVVAMLALAATALRDSNGTFFAVVAVVLVIDVAVRRLPRRVLTLAAVLFVVALVGSASASIGRRWEGPLKDVITIRIMNSPERLAYFERSGMPLSPTEIEKARGHCVTPTPVLGCVTIADPRFYEWIHQHGRATYAKSLAKYPATTLWQPVAYLRESIGTRVQIDIGSGTHEHAPVSKALEAVFFARNPVLAASWTVVMLALAAVALIRRIRGTYIVAAALVALTYPHLWLVWTGGALEVTRHSLLASLQLRLGIWLSVVWLLDVYLQHRHAPAAGCLPKRGGPRPRTESGGPGHNSSSICTQRRAT